MKGILEFDLPENQHDFERAVQALDLALALWSFDQWLRLRKKNTDNEEEYNVLDDIHEQFFEILNDHRIDLESILE